MLGLILRNIFDVVKNDWKYFNGMFNHLSCCRLLWHNEYQKCHQNTHQMIPPARNILRIFWWPLHLVAVTDSGDRHQISGHRKNHPCCKSGFIKWRQKGKNDLWLQVFLKLGPSRAKQTIYFGTHLARPAIGSWWWWSIWWGWQWECWGWSSFSMMILQMVIEKGVSIPRGSWPHQQSARIIISSNIATLALFFSY